MTTASFIRFDSSPADRAKLKSPASIARPIVSIVTPYYNSGDEFGETVRSVLAQTLTAFEWIIVDDGSTSARSLKQLDAVAKSDPRIRVVRHEENRGLPAARNTGFKCASTEAVLIIDADDLVEPTAVEKLFWYLCSFEEMSFCSGYTVGFGAQQYKWQRGFHETASFLKENLVSEVTMISRSVLICTES